MLRSRDSGIHQIVSRSSELGEYDRLEALQGRDRVRGKEPAVKRSRLQDEIAGLAGIGVGKEVVVAEDQVVALARLTIGATDVAHDAPESTRNRRVGDWPKRESILSRRIELHLYRTPHTHSPAKL